LIDQQLGGGMDNFSLGLEQLALEAGNDELPLRLCLTGIDRRVGAVERIEQFVAELADEKPEGSGSEGWIPLRAVRPVRALHRWRWC